VSNNHPNHRWWTLGAMVFALFMIMLDNTVVNIALPSISRSLGATQSELEWTLNAYVLSFASLILLGGKLGDRFGRKPMFMAGLAIFTVASAACALSPTIGWLILFRVLQGVGAGLYPLGFGIIRDEFPRERVAPSIAFLSALFAIGGGINVLLFVLYVRFIKFMERP